MNLSNLKIKTRILLLLIIPVIGMFYFLFSNVFHQYEFVKQRQDLARLTRMTPAISSFIHEAQKEMYFSILFTMAVKDDSGIKSLEKQRLITDSSKSELDLVLNTLEVASYNKKIHPAIEEQVAEVKNVLDEFSRVRAQVENLDISRDDVLNSYKLIINKLISSMALTAALSNDIDVNIDLSAHNVLEATKEAAAIERAIGAIGMAEGKFNKSIFNRFLPLISQQNSLLSVFNNLLVNDENVAGIIAEDINYIKRNNEVSEIRKLILNAGDDGVIDIGYTSEDWFNLSTKRIDKIYAAESALIGHVWEEIEEYNEDARKDFIVDIVNALQFLIVTLFLWFVVVRSIIVPIEEVAINLKKLADDDLSFNIKETGRKDEIGDIIRTMGVFKENIIERKKHEEQERTFISMVSHEFRTPLTIIDGNAQIIQKRGSTLDREVLEKRANTIRTAVDRLVGLIETILSDSVLRGGKLSIKPEACDLIKIIKDVCVEKLGVTPNSQIKLDIEKGIPKMVLDPKVMHQVIVNLISNAFKYSPNNPIIKVRLYKNNGNVAIQVSDNGVGIPDDEIPKLFTRYFRASTSGGISGTGLGLNLVKEMIELHGGRVYLESQVDVGTTVTIELPIGSKIKQEEV